jgi:hypothetical protein
MKKLFLVFVIFAVGTSLFCAFQSTTIQLRNHAAADLENWQAQTQRVAQMRIERESLEEHVQSSTRELNILQHVAMSRSVKDKFIPKVGQRLSPAEREKLLSELGFDWNSTGDYLIVSKETLERIGLDGMKGSKLSDVVSEVLAITPGEQAAIDGMTAQLTADYKTWAESHVHRNEPSGDVVASYSLPVDAEFSQTLSNAFVGGVLGTLGNERGNLLLDYSRSWMISLGMENFGTTPPATMIVKRYPNGDDRLSLETKQAGNTMRTDVSPWQPFPEAFLPLFPGGWADLAKREGFELPKSFQKKDANQS